MVGYWRCDEESCQFASQCSFNETSSTQDRIFWDSCTWGEECCRWQASTPEEEGLCASEPGYVLVIFCRFFWCRRIYLCAGLSAQHQSLCPASQSSCARNITQVFACKQLVLLGPLSALHIFQPPVWGYCVQQSDACSFAWSWLACESEASWAGPCLDTGQSPANSGSHFWTEWVAKSVQTFGCQRSASIERIAETAGQTEADEVCRTKGGPSARDPSTERGACYWQVGSGVPNHTSRHSQLVVWRSSCGSCFKVGRKTDSALKHVLPWLESSHLVT